MLPSFYVKLDRLPLNNNGKVDRKSLPEPDFANNFIEANNRALRKEIQKARSMTDGIIGVNIMVALSNYADFVLTSIDEGIDIIFSGAGLPLNLPKYLPKGNTKTKLVPIVSSGKAAALIARRWIEMYDYIPDAFVVEGPKAGGHLGFKKEQLFDENFSLEKLIVDIVEKIKPFEIKYNRKIPVIAAGGIYSGKDIHDIFKFGASGVQMATRFVTTFECDASDVFKDIYIKATKDDIQIIDSPVGMPGRALKNQFVIDVKKGEKKPFKCPYHCIVTCDFKNVPYCIAHALINAKKGDMENGFAFAGENVYKNDKVISVKELMETLSNEYIAAAN
jgi:NAD(P)H-dependent flavin oxidoreductase YrpB (nitropropane dioxygenase family)